MTALNKAPGRSSELDYLLDLAARRTPGRVQARLSSLQVGSSCVDGFPTETDAHYLAHAANLLPNMVQELKISRAMAQEQAAALAALREEVLSLSGLLEHAYQERDQARKALKSLRSLLWALRKQLKAKPSVEPVVHVVAVPASWFAPDGHAYELVLLGDQFLADLQ